jgi:hypothetical protein
MGNWKKSFWMPALFLTGAELWIGRVSGWHLYEVWHSNNSGLYSMTFLPFPPVLAHSAIFILVGAIGGLWSWLAGGRLWQRLLTGLSASYVIAGAFLVGAIAVVPRQSILHYWLPHFFGRIRCCRAPAIFWGYCPSCS